MILDNYLLLCGGGGGLVTKSCPTLATPWTIARQAPLSMGFSRQEYWSGLPFPSPGDPPNPGIEPQSPALQVLYCIAGRFFTSWAMREVLILRARAYLPEFDYNSIYLY